VFEHTLQQILLHCTPEIQILLHTELLWIVPDIVEVLLLANGPGVHQILEKELSREEDMIGFICSWMKAIGQKFLHANMVVSWLLLLESSSNQHIIRKLMVPPHLALGKKKDIVKSRIEWMEVRYALVMFPLPAIENDVPTI